MNHASSVGGDVESSSIISERENVQARRDGDASRSNSSSSEKEQKESLRKKRLDSKVTVDLRIGSLSHQVSNIANLIMHQLCVTINVTGIVVNKLISSIRKF